jgi:MYXO-CTERM domain-containing protein
VVAITAGLVWCAAPAWAVPLPIGGAVIAVGEPEPGVGASLVATTGAVPFGAPTYSGTLTSTVYDQDPTNPYGLSGYTFTYVIDNFVGSLHELHRFTVSSFENYQTDVSYSTLAGGTPPLFVDRSPTIGDVIGFSYPTPIPPVLIGPGPILPGTLSAIMVIQTDATDAQLTLAAIINGSVTMVESLAPAPIIPEPSTMVLATVGLVGLAVVALRRRRRRA